MPSFSFEDVIGLIKPFTNWTASHPVSKEMLLLIFLLKKNYPQTGNKAKDDCVIFQKYPTARH